MSIQEACSCGATFQVSSAYSGYEERAVQLWRESHLHERDGFTAALDAVLGVIDAQHAIDRDTVLAMKHANR
jgi:hypothetical protein